jgi:hypothetical protein
VARTARTRKALRILTKELLRQYTIESSKCRREDKSKIDLTKLICADVRWIELAED